jgi:hypothetical protein
LDFGLSTAIERPSEIAPSVGITPEQKVKCDPWSDWWSLWYDILGQGKKNLSHPLHGNSKRTMTFPPHSVTSAAFFMSIWCLRQKVFLFLSYSLNTRWGRAVSLEIDDFRPRPILKWLNQSPSWSETQNLSQSTAPEIKTNADPPIRLPRRAGARSAQTAMNEPQLWKWSAVPWGDLLH